MRVKQQNAFCPDRYTAIVSNDQVANDLGLEKDEVRNCSKTRCSIFLSTTSFPEQCRRS